MVGQRAASYRLQGLSIFKHGGDYLQSVPGKFPLVFLLALNACLRLLLPRLVTIALGFWATPPLQNERGIIGQIGHAD